MELSLNITLVRTTSSYVNHYNSNLQYTPFNTCPRSKGSRWHENANDVLIMSNYCLLIIPSATSFTCPCNLFASIEWFAFIAEAVTTLKRHCRGHSDNHPCDIFSLTSLFQPLTFARLILCDLYLVIAYYYWMMMKMTNVQLYCSRFAGTSLPAIHNYQHRHSTLFAYHSIPLL